MAEGFLPQRLVNNLFIANEAGRAGGAAARFDYSASDVSIQGNWIISNKYLDKDADEALAGGVLILENVDASRVVDNIFSHNSSRTGGVALEYLDFEDLIGKRVSANYFSHNDSESGAVIVFDPQPAESQLADLERQIQANDNRFFRNSPSDRLVLGKPGIVQRLIESVLGYLEAIAGQLANLGVVALLLFVLVWVSPIFALVATFCLSLIPLGGGVLRIMFLVPGLGRRVAHPYMKTIELVASESTSTSFAFPNELRKGITLLSGTWHLPEDFEGAFATWASQIEMPVVPVLLLDGSPETPMARRVAVCMTQFVRDRGQGWRARLVGRVGFTQQVVSEFLRSGDLILAVGHKKSSPLIPTSEILEKAVEGLGSATGNYLQILVDCSVDLTPMGDFADAIEAARGDVVVGVKETGRSAGSDEGNHDEAAESTERDTGDV